MSRPRMGRCIKFRPKINYFKPQGIPLSSLEVIYLLPEEIEALRLRNIEKLEQTEAAEKMKISQSTFQRILSSAYQKVTEALVKGKAIEIQD